MAMPAPKWPVEADRVYSEQPALRSRCCCTKCPLGAAPATPHAGVARPRGPQLPAPPTFGASCPACVTGVDPSQSRACEMRPPCGRWPSGLHRLRAPRSRTSRPFTTRCLTTVSGHSLRGTRNAAAKAQATPAARTPLRRRWPFPSARLPPTAAEFRGFGYAELDGASEEQKITAIRLLNNSKWNGQVLRVQLVLQRAEKERLVVVDRLDGRDRVVGVRDVRGVIP